METPPELADEASLNNHPQITLINNFCEITTCPKSQALFFLESHKFDLDAAVSTFFDDTNTVSADYSPNSPAVQSDDSSSPSPYRSRSRSPRPASQSYNLRPSSKPRIASGRRRGGRGLDSGVQTLKDLNLNPKDDDSDSDPDFDPQEYYTGGEKSEMLVQDPSKESDVDAIFDQARQAVAVGEPPDHLMPSSFTNFSGPARLLSGAVPVSSTPQPPEVVNHHIVFWRNGFTVDDGPLRRFDNPANASFLESLKRSNIPEELAPANKSTLAHFTLTRKEEDYKELKKPQLPFRGLGRAISDVMELATSVSATSSPSTAAVQIPSPVLVVDEAQPCTSIQIRLIDGTRIVSRFNTHHTIRDIQGFIDASSRADGMLTYQLQSMGFPPKQLTDLDQTIKQAGIANSVVIQKL